VLLLASACHRSAPAVTAQPTATTLDKVWLLEASGAPVADTSVIFAVATGRTIVLRHAPPDNAIFVMVTFPASKDSLRTRDSMHVTIQPTPARYAFTLATPDKIEAGVQATFSYAIHFQTPAGARTTYPVPGRFEAQIGPAQIGADNKVQFLVGARPAADMIRFPVTIPGTYALAAVR
jgi:hypothetical protein